MSDNFDLKEQIRDYWSVRAETFDNSFSHQITEGVELDAWKLLYAEMLGSGEKHVLDLGCGTGEVSKVLLASGHRVTGLDFSDTMLAKARAKHADKGKYATFLSGDAENINQPDNTFDAVTCRHLVWTLLEPEKALTDWFRVLKPGGHLVIFDGNFMHRSITDVVLKKLIALLDKQQPQSGQLQQQNIDIRRQLPFAHGLDYAVLKSMVVTTGFREVVRHSFTPIRRAQRRIAGPADWLRSFTTDRFVLHARKPG